MRPLTMVAMGRLLLSLFASVSIYADPSQPTGDTTLTYAILAAYAVFAAVVIFLTLRGVRNPRLGLLGHVIDISFFAVLIHLTDGAASPFFVYFTFVLFTAAIGWGWRGAAITTAATVAVYLFLTSIDDADLWLHIDRIIIRVSYLVVAGIFFCYFAAIAEASRLRLARLADWPAAEAGRGPIAGILEHAADILKLSRIVVVWRQDGATQAAIYAGGETRLGLMPETPHFDPIAGPSTVPDGQIWALLAKLPNALQANQVDHGFVVPLPEYSSGGYVILVGRQRFGRDFRPLASIVATRIAAELKHEELQKQLIRTGVAEERAKLAQDIHDDILQSLTAVALRLKTVEAGLPSEMAEQLTAVRDLVTAQQRRLRELVTEAGNNLREADGSFGRRMRVLTAMLRSQWACAIDLELQSSELPLAETTIRNVELFITEAVANGVRHGQARHFEIRQQIIPDWLELSIRDDGRGIEGSTGAYDHEAVVEHRLGSASLRTRAQALNWRIQLESSDQGTRIVIQIPLRDAPSG